MWQRDGCSGRKESKGKERAETLWQARLSLQQHTSLTFTHACLVYCCFTAAPPPEWTEQSKETQKCWFGQGRARTRSLAGCTESSPVITGRYWGGQWQPGGSNQAGCHPAGCRWSPSDGLWWTGSFWIPRHRLHASPAWTRSSPPGPAGAAESSPWDTNTGIILDRVPELIVVCKDLRANKCIFKH